MGNAKKKFARPFVVNGFPRGAAKTSAGSKGGVVDCEEVLKGEKEFPGIRVPLFNYSRIVGKTKKRREKKGIKDSLRCN